MEFRFWGAEIEMNEEAKREWGEVCYIPRSSRSPSMVTRSVADRRSSESIKQQRSISGRTRC